jgi:hypothetical protein
MTCKRNSFTSDSSTGAGIFTGKGGVMEISSWKWQSQGINNLPATSDTIGADATATLRKTFTGRRDYTRNP